MAYERESQDPFDMGSGQPETQSLQPSTVATDIAVHGNGDIVERGNADEAALVVEEVMDVQLSVGVRSEVEKVLEGEDTSPMDENRKGRLQIGRVLSKKRHCLQTLSYTHTFATSIRLSVHPSICTYVLAYTWNEHIH